MATTVGLLIATARLAGADQRAAALAGLLALLLTVENLAVRSQLLTLPLFAAVCLLVQLGRRRPLLLLLLPPVFALWANLHATFPLGLLYVAICLVGELADGLAAGQRPASVVRSDGGRLLLALVASAAATLANPLGFGVYGYVLEVGSHPVVRRLTAEWLPASFQEPSGLFLAASIALVGAALRLSRRRVGAHEVLLLLVFGYLALAAWRSIVWWGVVLAPILARHASAISLPAGLSRRFAPAGEADAAPPALRLVLAGLLLLQGLLSPLWVSTLPGKSAVDPYEVKPSAEAASFLAGLPAGSRLYHYESWDGYLAWRLWPTQQPMIDARVEAHPESVWVDYAAITFGAAEWESLVERYGIGYLVLHPTVQTRLAALAAATGRWDEIYRDDGTIVLARRAASGTVAERLRAPGRGP